MSNRSVAMQTQAGTSLLEVLIAVVVLSVGLLGLAGLQVAGLRVNQGAMQRSQATMLAYDVLDRMRSDRTAALAGKYDVGTTSPVSSEVLADSTNLSLKQWGLSLGHALVGSEGRICRTSNPASMACAANSTASATKPKLPSSCCAAWIHARARSTVNCLPAPM